jgi:predicted lipoprotein with Yx(FWY)xxD motif
MMSSNIVSDRAQGKTRPALLTASALVAATSLLFGGAAVSAASTKPEAKGTAAVVKEMKIAKLGTVLVDRDGLTLYRFTPDTTTKVACTGTCASLWPPLVVSGGTRVLGGSAGIAGLGTVKDPDGALQVTFRGHPLYTYIGDTKPGSAAGQGLKGKWFAVTPSVAPLGQANLTLNLSSGRHVGTPTY